jgi:hypothetical protein
MIYVMAALVVALGVLWITSPKRHAVHAGRYDVFPKGTITLRPWLGFGLARDEAGKLIDVRGMFIGIVYGDSMIKNNIFEGSTLLARRFSEEEKRELSIGDIVIVKETKPESDKAKGRGYCLRKIRMISATHVEYEDDKKGKYSSHPLSQVRALVIYVSPPNSARAYRTPMNHVGDHEAQSLAA